MTGSVPRVLSIAGTDPTGGAGLQADLKAIAALDGYGMGVVTALVAQNTHGVRSVHVPDPAFLREQLDAVSDDVVVDAVKIGMLGTAEVVRTVTAWLREHRPPVVVVDPVMVATSGDRLLDPSAARAMGDLFALADLVTPNRAELTELAVLAGASGTADRTPTDLALLVARRWDVLVLAKGGHDDGPTADDVLVAPDGTTRTFTAPRVDTTNTHGTGCSLSSAIATLAADAGDWELAVGGAKTWLTAALRGADALHVGTGNGPVDHGAAARAARPPVVWTDRWWDDVAATLDEVLACDFLVGLRDGTLDEDVFAGYLAQDVHYLRAYERHLARLADVSAGRRAPPGRLRRRAARTRPATSTTAAWRVRTRRTRSTRPAPATSRTCRRRPTRVRPPSSPPPSCRASGCTRGSAPASGTRRRDTPSRTGSGRTATRGSRPRAPRRPRSSRSSPPRRTPTSAAG